MSPVASLTSIWVNWSKSAKRNRPLLLSKTRESANSSTSSSADASVVRKEKVLPAFRHCQIAGAPKDRQRKTPIVTAVPFFLQELSDELLYLARRRSVDFVAKRNEGIAFFPWEPKHQITVFRVFPFRRCHTARQLVYSRF